MRFPVSKPSIGLLELDTVGACLDDGWITQGKRVAAFESQLAARLSVCDERVVACASGTAALHLALVAAGIGPGDQVLVPDLTYIATLNAVRYVGATPVLVDVDERTWNVNLDEARRCVTGRTKAVIAVHLYGVPCDFDQLTQFTRENGLLLVEDAAEALGARFAGGQSCGTAGVGCFSFYANKIITTAEGGAVIADTPVRAELLRSLRGQGQSLRARFVHDRLGFNYRMSDLHAALGIAQLQRFDDLVARREAVVRTYARELGGILQVPEPPTDAVTAPWLFTGLLPRGTNRAQVMGALAARGIETRPTFVPLHRQPCYAQSDKRFRVASDVGDRGISLPTYPELTADDVWFISTAVKEAL